MAVPTFLILLFLVGYIIFYHPINISFYMNKALILVLLFAASQAFEIQENLQVPRTNIGN